MDELDREALKLRFSKLIDNFKGHPQFPDEVLDMLEIHSKKSNDYATDNRPFANIELCETVGYPAWKGVVIRLGDKYSRLLNALTDKLLKCEGVEDSFKDMATYAIIGLLEYRKLHPQQIKYGEETEYRKK